MIKRFLIGAGYGVIGLAVAIALTLGAYAVAGKDLSRPANPVGAGKALGPSGSQSPTSPDKGTARHDRIRQHLRAQRIHQRRIQRRQNHGQPVGPILSSPSGSGPGGSPNVSTVSPSQTGSKGDGSGDGSSDDKPGGSSGSSGSTGSGSGDD